MRNFNASVTLSLGFALVWSATAFAQGRGGGGDWITTGGDAQRSNWVRSDPKISVEHFQKPGFALTWRIKLNDEPSIASTLDRYIGYRGFRSYAFVGSASGELTAIDTDLGRIEWQKKVSGGGVAAPAGCPAGMTANVTRPPAVVFAGGGRGNFGAPGGRGRSGAKSAVGEPGQGAVTLTRPPNPDAPGGANAGRGGRGLGVDQTFGAPSPTGVGPTAVMPGVPGPPGGPGRGGGFGRQGSFLNALSSDGMFHSMYVSNGDEPKPAVALLPPNANARDLTLTNNVAYVVTAGGCGGVSNGIWALDTTSSQVFKWTTTADIAGPGFAFGPDATVYAATSAGELLGLDPKTLEVKNAYKTSGEAFSSAPVVFQYNTRPVVPGTTVDPQNTKVVVAAATQDGHVHLVDAASFSGAAFPAVVAGDLSSWEDASGTRWLLGPAKDSVTAWKVVYEGGTPVLKPGWKSGELAAPLTPIIVNDVVFTVSNSPSAVLHALDGASGRELWNSGKTMTAAVRTSALSGSGSQIYIGTSDGRIYAFGFPIEH